MIKNTKFDVVKDTPITLKNPLTTFWFIYPNPTRKIETSIIVMAVCVLWYIVC